MNCLMFLYIMTSANNAMTYIRFIMLKISDTTGEANKKGTSMLSHLEYRFEMQMYFPLPAKGIICVTCMLLHHEFMYCPDAYSTPSHYLKQHRFVTYKITLNIS